MAVWLEKRWDWCALEGLECLKKRRVEMQLEGAVLVNYLETVTSTFIIKNAQKRNGTWTRRRRFLWKSEKRQKKRQG